MALKQASNNASSVTLDERLKSSARYCLVTWSNVSSGWLERSMRRYASAASEIREAESIYNELPKLSLRARSCSHKVWASRRVLKNNSCLLPVGESSCGTLTAHGHLRPARSLGRRDDGFDTYRQSYTVAVKQANLCTTMQKDVTVYLVTTTLPVVFCRINNYT